MTDAVTTLNDAVRRAAAAYPNRVVLRAGWDTGDSFIVSTENPDLPAFLRAEEEDAVLVRVEKCSGDTKFGTYVSFYSEVTTSPMVGDSPVWIDRSPNEP